MYLSEDTIDRLLAEDVPYFDLTSWVLGIRDQSAAIRYFTREDAVVCGTEEVARIFERLHITLDEAIPSGQYVKAGTQLIAGHGRAEDLHTAWKVGQNLLDHCSGIATRTRAMVDAARKWNPTISILTTRKGFPGTKALATKAVIAGGALPHRLGLSETLLVFKQHLNMIGGFEAFLPRIREIKAGCCEKKLLAEADSQSEAEALCEAGIDGIQFDKLSAQELCATAQLLRTRYPNVILLAAGGINEHNVEQYARAEINGIVTTSLYSAKPIDVGVKIERIPQGAAVAVTELL